MQIFKSYTCIIFNVTRKFKNKYIEIFGYIDLMIFLCNRNSQTVYRIEIKREKSTNNKSKYLDISINKTNAYERPGY